MRASRGGRERGRGRGKEDSKEWDPVTELVRDGKIRTLEEIYLYSLPILNRSLKDECAEDHARPKADSCRSVPVSRRSSPSVTLTASSVSASSAARKWPPPSAVPLSWPSCRSCRFAVVTGVTISASPTPCSARSLASAVTVLVHLNPVRIVPAPVPKKLLQMAGIEDCVGVAKLEIRVTSYTNLSGGSSAMLR
ncbi:hypothetical protein pipiens_017338 [Culex pipiens pipiens]|uniref:40S ribosomal protein S2 n=1 Tax=Culex pipiens pipiens TaxID=38569 RepID=A0ABD1CH55_CULPP